jgi:hypothetical protein
MGPALHQFPFGLHCWSCMLNKKTPRVEGKNQKVKIPKSQNPDCSYLGFLAFCYFEIFLRVRR